MSDAPQVVEAQPINPLVHGYKVVDTDFHFTPRFSDIKRYLKEPFKSVLTAYPPTALEYRPMENRSALNYNPDTASSAVSDMGTAFTPEEIVAVLDSIGADQVVINPGYPRISAVFNEEVAGAIVSAYNDLLAREILPGSKRLKGTLVIEQRTPQRAADEIRRVGANPDIVGVYAEYGPYEPLGHAKYDPVFEALEEMDLPLVIHGSGFWPPYSTYWSGAMTWAELIGLSWPSAASVFAGSMIMQGVFDKFPKLKVIVQEGGLWWTIEFRHRMDEFYLNHPRDIQLLPRKLQAGEQYLKKLPSAYLGEHFYFSTQPMARPKNAQHFQALLEMCDARHRFMYSSDWPHPTFDPVNWLFEGRAIDEELRVRVLHDNATEVFRGLT